MCQGSLRSLLRASPGCFRSGFNWFWSNLLTRFKAVSRQFLDGFKEVSRGFKLFSWGLQRSFKEMLWKFQRCFKKVPWCFKRVLSEFQGNFKGGSRVFHKRLKKVSNGSLSKFQGGFQDSFNDISRTFHRTLKCLWRVVQGSLKAIS